MERNYRIVGWGVMTGDEICETTRGCTKPATCYSDVGGEMTPCCRECAKHAARDEVAEAFASVFAK